MVTDTGREAVLGSLVLKRQKQESKSKTKAADRARVAAFPEAASARNKREEESPLGGLTLRGPTRLRGFLAMR